MEIFALRLKPNDDLRISLRHFIKQHQIEAGFIITAVGSLKQATLRFSGQNDAQAFNRHFEIVSLVGTLSIHGIHLHIALSDRNGQTIGGHLLEGCIIYTTAEIIVGASDNLIFLRTMDETTGYKELEIKPK